jgi:hypothetical protein
VHWGATYSILAGICYGIDAVRNNWTFSISVTKLTVTKQKLQRLRMCWTLAVKCAFGLGIISSCLNWSGCDTCFVPKRLSGVWGNYVPDDIARITAVTAHYAQIIWTCHLFCFQFRFLKSEHPPDLLQGGGGMVGATCLFVTDVDQMYLWKVMLNAVSIQERTVMSFNCSFLPLI